MIVVGVASSPQGSSSCPRRLRGNLEGAEKVIRNVLIFSLQWFSFDNLINRSFF